MITNQPHHATSFMKRQTKMKEASHLTSFHPRSSARMITMFGRGRGCCAVTSALATNNHSSNDGTALCCISPLQHTDPNRPPLSLPPTHTTINFKTLTTISKSFVAVLEIPKI